MLYQYNLLYRVTAHSHIGIPYHEHRYVRDVTNHPWAGHLCPSLQRLQHGGYQVLHTIWDRFWRLMSLLKPVHLGLFGLSSFSAKDMWRWSSASAIRQLLPLFPHSIWIQLSLGHSARFALGLGPTLESLLPLSSWLIHCELPSLSSRPNSKLPKSVLATSPPHCLADWVPPAFPLPICWLWPCQKPCNYAPTCRCTGVWKLYAFEVSPAGQST